MSTATGNPYVGPRTFQKEESHLFFGREREARDLAALVSSERLVLFYAQSGAGKSSLLNTRLIPDLENNRYEVFPVGRVSSGGVGEAAAGNVYIYNLLRSLVQHEIDPGSIANLSLSQFLGHLNVDDDGYFYDASAPAESPDDEGYTPWRRALIIDQFEEVFSTHLDAWEKREDFFRQLAQAMQDDPYLWVVLVMREDYIAALDPYAHLLPGGLRTRYYMQRLSREAALRAMKKPVENLRPYADGVAEKLVENLASIKVQKPSGRLEAQPGQYVEPVQLQVVCYGLWEHLSSEGTQITEKDLEEVGDVNQSLERYYDGRVSAVAKEKNVTERSIREWFEKELITSGGVRNIVLREESGASGLADNVIQTLQGDLIRAEMRAGQVWYELSHDRLIEPILNSNAKWFEQHLKMFQRQAALWMQQGRSDSLLFRDKELQVAETEAKTLTLTRDEQTFLDACRALRKRVFRDRVIFALIAIGFAVQLVVVYFLIVSQKQVELEKTNAIQAKVTAMAAQAVAEDERKSAVLAKRDADQARDDANEQAKLALAGKLAAQADSQKNNDHALALLLAREAYLGDIDSLLTRTTLFQLLQYSPYTRFFGYKGPVSSIAVSPDGTMFASASCREYSNYQCKYGEIILSDADGQPIAKVSGDYGVVNSLAFHQYDDDGNDKLLLAAGGCVPLLDDQNKGCTDNKGQIKLWDITKAGSPVPLGESRLNHTGLVKTIAINPDGNLLASGSFDTRIVLWDISDPTKPVMKGIPLQGHHSFVNSLAFSVDGNTLVSAGDDQRIVLWNVTHPSNAVQTSSYTEEHTAPINSIAFSPYGKKFASASDDNTVMLWDWDSASHTLQNPIPLEGHEGYVRSVAFNVDGTRLASAGFDNKVILWDVAMGEPIGLPLAVHTKAINALAFGAQETSEKLFTASDDHTVTLWDLSTRTRKPLSQPLKEISSPPEVDVRAISGSLEASVLDEQKIQLSNRTEPLTGHTGAINSLSFSPQKIDGRLLLASASDDQTVILWDVSDPSKAAVFLKLESFDNPVRAAYFEGTQLITVENGGRSIQWNIDPSSWPKLACDAVGPRVLSEDEVTRFLQGQPQTEPCP
jgi:WD40 repeat protein